MNQGSGIRHQGILDHEGLLRDLCLLFPKADEWASSERTAIPESKVPQVLCSGTKMNER